MQEPDIAKSSDNKGSIHDDSGPLIFISHDGRDAELAEAFSKLLRGVSGGVLKSFRSSDRVGTEGIQYGDEWYKRLMEKLKNANDVVCLFTRRSLNKPWILYEAGVAKGKLDTRVHGVALGVQLSEISIGPFYQFQNCQDDEDGLTGLVLQLLRCIPGTDPDQSSVQLQVMQFKSEADKIIARVSGDGEADSEEDSGTGASSAKLFEEVKVMLRDLPSNLEQQLVEGGGPMRAHRLRRMHPMMIEEMVQMSESKDPYLGILLIVSMFRDDIPWLYELGIEAYRASMQQDKVLKNEALMRFRDGFRLIERGPWGEEFMMRSKGSFRILHMLDESIHRLIDRREHSNEEKDDSE